MKVRSVIITTSYIVSTVVFQLALVILELNCAGTAGGTLWKAQCYYRDGGSFIFSFSGTFLIDLCCFLSLLYFYKPKNKNLARWVPFLYLIFARIVWIVFIQILPRPYQP